MLRLTAVFGLVVAGLLVPAFAEYAVGCDRPKELGRVAWQRQYEAALSASGETGKPVFLLFQEIPGCATCVQFGDEPLSHPLLVEAIETEFVPLAIHNNKPGADEVILKKFDEPAWNYPVARFIRSDGKDIIPRRDRVWTTHGLAARMISALETADRDVPAYLRLVEMESRLTDPQRATFAMHCYWEGEARLGALDGVITTTAGWKDSLETVDVLYDPTVVNYETLVHTARQLECATAVYAYSDEDLTTAKRLVGNRARLADAPSRLARDSDRKYHLKRTTLHYLPLSPMQRTKVNAAVLLGKDPNQWLSPRQREMAKHIATITAEQPNALKDLTPPERLDELPAYLDLLTQRLEALSME